MIESNVPKLEVSGKNWAIYRIRSTHAMQSKGVWGHLDGSTVQPTTAAATPVVAAGQTAPGPTPTPTTVAPTESAELIAWRKDG